MSKKRLFRAPLLAALGVLFRPRRSRRSAGAPHRASSRPATASVDGQLAGRLRRLQRRREADDEGHRQARRQRRAAGPDARRSTSAPSPGTLKGSRQAAAGQAHVVQRRLHVEALAPGATEQVDDQRLPGPAQPRAHDRQGRARDALRGRPGHVHRTR